MQRWKVREQLQTLKLTPSKSCVLISIWMGQTSRMTPPLTSMPFSFRLQVSSRVSPYLPTNIGQVQAPVMASGCAYSLPVSLVPASLRPQQLALSQAMLKRPSMPKAAPIHSLQTKSDHILLKCFIVVALFGEQKEKLQVGMWLSTEPHRPLGLRSTDCFLECFIL